MSQAAFARIIEEVSTLMRTEQRAVSAVVDTASAKMRDISTTDQILLANEFVETLTHCAVILEKNSSVFKQYLLLGALNENEGEQLISRAQWSAVEANMSSLYESLTRLRAGHLTSSLHKQVPQASPDSHDSILELIERVDRAEQAASIHIRSTLATLEQLRPLVRSEMEEAGAKTDDPSAPLLPLKTSDNPFDYENERRRIIERFPKILARLGE